MGPGSRLLGPHSPASARTTCPRLGHVVTGLPHQDDAGKNICLWLPERSVIQLNQKHRASLECRAMPGSGAEPWGSRRRVWKGGLGSALGAKTPNFLQGFPLAPAHPAWARLSLGKVGEPHVPPAVVARGGRWGWWRPEVQRSPSFRLTLRGNPWPAEHGVKTAAGGAGPRLPRGRQRAV